MNELENLIEEIDDLKNIEDDDEDVGSTSTLFSISSFGVDYPVETLVNRMKREQFYIPHFQRKYVWSKTQASRFIESLLLGLPVPGIFLFKEPETGKHLVIDGQQRLKTLHFFFIGLFYGKEFRLQGLQSDWNGKTYATLSEAEKARLNDAVVHATVFQQDLPRGEMNSVYEVFERINTGGTKLSPQEIRSCICHGNFNSFLHRLNDNHEWRAIYGPKSKRLKDIEVLLRFFAFFERAQEYTGPMKHFLNDFMKEKRNHSDNQLAPLEEIFVSTFTFINRSLGKRAFRPDRALNTAVFDSVASSIAIMLQSNNSLDEKGARIRYENLLKNERFVEGYIRSTADPEHVKKRIEEARSAFCVR